METRDDDRVREQVRNAYAEVAKAAPGCAVGCCAGGQGGSLELGYTEEDLASAPNGADLGLGCGNPQAMAALQPGETVLDLGSGAGFDCFLAAKRVGPTGRVIGVDMTPEMVVKARGNARRVGVTNVEFRLAEIEHLPAPDASVDVVLSNCVINLSPDKASVFREALRVLKPGGRLAISDIVAMGPMPHELERRLEALTGCVSGAATVDVLLELLVTAGFENVKIEPRVDSDGIVGRCMPGAEPFVASATIEGRKPGGACCAPSCCTPKGAAA